MKTLQQEQIGWLEPRLGHDGIVHSVAVCFMCQNFHEDNPVPLYKINVEPYRQTCQDCGDVLNEGQAGFCELYTK